MSIESTKEIIERRLGMSGVRVMLGGAGLIGLFAAVTYLASLQSAVFSILALATYALIAAIVVYAVRAIFRKKQPLDILFVRIIFRFGSAVLLTVLVVGGFCYYQNEIDPARLGIYSISNGEKTVEFHSMAHIASEQFYSDTKEWVKAKKAAGYTLFFEGVRPGNPVNEAKFNALLGFAFTPDLYKEFSKLYGLWQQDNQEFLGFSGAEDKNVDISIDDIITLYEAKNGPIVLSGATSSGVTASGIVLSGSTASWVVSSGSTASGVIASASGEENPATTLSLEAEISRFVEEIPPRQLAVIRYFNRSVLNFLIKHKSFGLQQSELVAAPWLFDVILQERNKHLVQEIAASDSKKIIVLYGDLHFEGTFDILQEKDVKWKTTSQVLFTEPMRP